MYTPTLTARIGTPASIAARSFPPIARTMRPNEVRFTSQNMAAARASRAAFRRRDG